MLRLSRPAAFHVRKLRSLRERCRSRLRLEELECRTVPSVFTPGQIRHAYGFDQIAFTANGQTVAGTGLGQTIAIVGAYDAPTITSDLQSFDKQFGIADLATTSGTSPYLKKVSPSGVLPAANAAWAREASLDVEWAHAIAPQANILLVEANSSSLGDLLNAVSYAANQHGVAAVSMSWGGSEFVGQSLYDSVFTTPANHNGVTFVASSGDSGAWSGAQWPAASPNVLSVGGTSLTLNSLGDYAGESAWGGSTGGYSQVVSEPSYQLGVQNTGVRTVPDLAYDANPYTGMYMYDSYAAGQSGWYQAGGTSAGAPQIAAMVAIADQGRALAGKGSLDGATQTLPYIYNLASSSYSTYFHDVTSGANGFRAQTGYNLVTGLGTPKANALVSGLVNAGAATTSQTVQVTVSVTAGTTSSQAGSTTGTSGNAAKGSNGQQTATGPVNQTPFLFIVTVYPTLASAAGVGGAQGVATQASTRTVSVVDPRVVPLATPGAQLTPSQVNGGGGNNALGGALQQSEEDDPDNSENVTPVPQMSPNAPRMAPDRVPEDMMVGAAAAWRQASDFCFAADNWTAPQEQSAPALAVVSDDSGSDPSAAFLGLSIALGSYWGAPAKKEDERKRGQLDG